jgi:16S rRNA processing protein RimM
MEPEAELLAAGRITGPHGIKGWVKIESYTDPAENFLEFGEWLLQRPEGAERVEFDQGRRHGKGLVAHIRGVDDRSEAEHYRGLVVAVPASRLPSLAEGDYYWRQLEGLQVWCREGGEGDAVYLGVVDHLLETGANDVLVVRATDGSIDGRERLIPYLPGDVVTRIDTQAGVIEVNWFVED